MHLDVVDPFDFAGAPLFSYRWQLAAKFDVGLSYYSADCDAYINGHASCSLVLYNVACWGPMSCPILLSDITQWYDKSTTNLQEFEES